MWSMSRRWDTMELLLPVRKLLSHFEVGLNFTHSYVEFFSQLNFVALFGNWTDFAGHSLGGGLSIITGAQTGTPAVALSGPNAMLSRRSFDPRISIEDLDSKTFVRSCYSFELLLDICFCLSHCCCITSLFPTMTLSDRISFRSATWYPWLTTSHKTFNTFGAKPLLKMWSVATRRRVLCARSFTLVAVADTLFPAIAWQSLSIQSQFRSIGPSPRASRKFVVLENSAFCCWILINASFAVSMLVLPCHVTC